MSIENEVLPFPERYWPCEACIRGKGLEEIKICSCGGKIEYTRVQITISNPIDIYACTLCQLDYHIRRKPNDQP